MAKRENKGGDLPFEDELWETAERLRGSVESAEYKHLVLGLIFLKYISDSFERQRAKLDQATRDSDSDLFTGDDAEREEILEDRDEYIQENVFWVPEEARFEQLLAEATQPDIGQRIDKALEAIERDNPEQLRGVLPKVYGRSELEPSKLGELVGVIARVGFGDDEEKARDLLGRTYEYFIKLFAKAEGHRGGEFYTPSSVVQLLVELLEPFEGRVFDPACGSCGMFIQSARFVEAHGGRSRQISIYGQELNHTTGRIGRMNLAIHGLGGNIKIGQSSLTADQHSGLRADYVLANPPFNQEYWGADQGADDPRWKYGLPPDRNANYAWIQHFIHHLAPDGRAGFVLANGSLTSNQSGEGEIRKAIIEDDLVDCIVAMPGQLFFTTQIPVCLWFLDRNKASSSERDRKGETLFIDARQMGEKISRTQIELTVEELQKIASTYHAWRGTTEETYEDIQGFCASVKTDAIAKQSYALTPGRYVGAPESEEDEIDFEERMATLTEQLADQFAESERLSGEVRAVLEAVGYEV
jgi:type I restriction enzyme M protein